MNLFNTQISLSPCHFFPLRSRYLNLLPVFRYPQYHFLPSCSFHTHEEHTVLLCFWRRNFNLYISGHQR